MKSGRRVTLSPRWSFVGPRHFGRRQWVPAENDVTVGPGSASLRYAVADEVLHVHAREGISRLSRQLFCTSNTLEQAQASRTLVFILLQLSLALSIMKDDPQGWSNE